MPDIDGEPEFIVQLLPRLPRLKSSIIPVAGKLAGPEDGETDALGETDAETDEEGDTEGETEALGDTDLLTEALGETDALPWLVVLS